ncbi:MAG: MFS transporter [Kiritimatiellia bacterium]|jgi:acyl-[acyl-carrier-protein]-phospholipid O-acyltransferase/long-chain-fatty-acid--[acyl-carrier-protein] ligase
MPRKNFEDALEMRWTFDKFRRRRREAFAWLNATQFFGALNDNVFKALVQMFILGLTIGSGSGASAVPLAVATMLFAIPFLLFTSYAGYLADRFSKNVVTVILKYAELGIMLLAVAAFAAGWTRALYALLFLMSVQSALFSPTKYSIIPELVRTHELARANSLLVACSFLAIIAGSALAPGLAEATSRLFDSPRAAYAVAQGACVLFAVAGILTSHRVVPLRSMQPGLHPDLFFPRQMWRTWAWVRRDRDLALALAGSWLFSMLAAFLQINLVLYGIQHLGLDEKASSFLFFYAALGIAFGAWASGRLSKRNIEFGTLPGGAFLLAFSTLALGLLPEGGHPVLVPAVVFSAGLGAGLFVVPLDTFLQLQLPADRRGEGLALNSFLSWSGILLAGALLLLFDVCGVNAQAGFLFFSIPAMVLALVSLFKLKDFALRFFVTMLIKLFYQVRTIGLEHLPVTGAALLIANHSSYMDALLLCATTRRRLRFFMSETIYNKHPLLRRIFDLYDVIPVDEHSTPRQIATAVRTARAALDEGFMVCVFAEGGLTRTGTIRAFKRGFEHVLRGTDHPIIPIYLGGSWGTTYHYHRGRLVRRMFRLGRRRYKVVVVFGRPLPAGTNAFRTRQAVMELSCDYFNARKEEHASLGRTYVSRARERWRKPFANDTTGLKLTSGRALIASIALARAIGPRVKDDEHVGILLPGSCAGLLCNLACALLGRSAVNLNFTVGSKVFRSSVEQCNLTTVLTSRQVMERFAGLELPEEKRVYVEDILKGMTPGAKLRCLFLAKFAPFESLCDTRPTDADTPALVLFSSGSTGEPKGVMLSQHNVLAMIESLLIMLPTSVDDRICGTLPLFHSFGIMGTVWYPVLGRMMVSYHSNPLDAQAVARVVRENRCTMLFGTPTFLSLYMRKAAREDFQSLGFVLAGAEKLQDSLTRAFEEKFGIRPYEAYGATELSPGIAVSVPHGVGGGVVQEGWREGRTGLLLPGLAVKVVDPDTGLELGPGEPGLIHLKGPNLMLGYLGRPDLTDEAVQGGWYCTGDIGLVDEDGFVGLTDRLSRFSKLGGEMVPHVAVEEALLKTTGLSGPVLAVAGVPDERKGEKLVVLYTDDCGDPQALWEALEKTDLPGLWRPARINYHRVDAIPVLGTGKLDLSAIKKLALKCDAEAARPAP